MVVIVVVQLLMMSIAVWRRVATIFVPNNHLGVSFIARAGGRWGALRCDARLKHRWLVGGEMLLVLLLTVPIISFLAH